MNRLEGFGDLKGMATVFLFFFGLEAVGDLNGSFDGGLKQNE